MTKQEEIRVGIHALFSNCFCRGKLSGKNANDWANKYTYTLLADLKSEGVVIKVERECFQCDGKGYTKIESTCPVCRGKKTESYTEELI